MSLDGSHKESERRLGVSGQHSTVVAFALPDPAASGLNPGIPEFFQRVDVAEVNLHYCCLELWTAEA